MAFHWRRGRVTGRLGAEPVRGFGRARGEPLAGARRANEPRLDLRRRSVQRSGRQRTHRRGGFQVARVLMVRAHGVAGRNPQAASILRQ